jgi:hypothetical protein
LSEVAVQADDHLQACFDAVYAKCGAAGVRVERLPLTSPEKLLVQLQGSDRPWKLRVDCTWPRYTTLPSVVLLENKQRLAHVGYGGTVCVNDAQGLSLDLDQREDVIASTVLEAFSVLERSAVDAAGDQAEFYNELEGYWGGLPGIVLARSAVNRGDARLVTAYEGGNTAAWYFVETRGSPPPEFDVKKLRAARAAYFTLPTPLEPPPPGSRLDHPFLDTVLAALTPAQQQVWQQVVGASTNGVRKVAMLLAMPRRDGGHSEIGLAFSVYRGRPVAHSEFTPFLVSRHTPEYMRERGGAAVALRSKHVVIFGCGAVGSEVADALASCGVGKLTVVDPDLLQPDNVFRHRLGPLWTGVRKAGGLKHTLEPRYPGLTVHDAPMGAQEWLDKNSLDGVDGVVLALGLPTLERVLTRRLRESGLDLPVVVTWLEAMDLGGHSVLLRTGRPGCLDCVYRDEEGAADLAAQTSFLAPGQKVTRNLTGCGSIFVPYGALQSRQTALLAAGHMLEALAGMPAPSYRFWVGSGNEAAAQGLKSTAWWVNAHTTSATTATHMVFGRPCSRCRGAAS